MKKVVVYLGSFNPVTKAHYEIMCDAVNCTNADQGVFVATNDSYLTKKMLLKIVPPTNFILPLETRAEMLQSLHDKNPKLSYWGAEMGGVRADQNRTIAKLKKDMQKKYPNEEICLFSVIGADKLRRLSKWHNIDELFDICNFLVYDRKTDIDDVLKSNVDFFEKYKDQILYPNFKKDLADVSSTEIRRRFYAGEDYRDLMNDGPYNILSRFSPKDFPEPTPEDMIKATIHFGGWFGKRNAMPMVYKANTELFKKWPAFLGDKAEHFEATAYKEAFSVYLDRRFDTTIYGCENSDCVDVAERLVKEGLKPAILNLASRVSPGGGYHKGADAQEESLCHMSTLSLSLYQFGNPKYKHIKQYAKDFGVTPVAGVYPMDLNFGGIYSPCVTFFRKNYDNDFAMRKEPFDCPVISVASISNRQRNNFTNDERIYFDDEGCLTAEGREIQKNKMRTIFRIALENGRDSLILGAFGCGVFRLRCDEVAQLFRDVLPEDEFKNRFRKIIFAIYEGKRPRTENKGKFEPFYKLFGV